MTWQAYATTHNGNVRSSNEDAYLARNDIGLWAVADGMGGHDAGELASEVLINALWNIPGDGGMDKMLDYVSLTAEAVNRNLYSKLEQSATEQTIGTTLAALIVQGNQGACIWAGDSRVYRLHNGKLQQLTRDHSVVQELVDQGVVHPEQAASHPQSNIITRAIGVAAVVELEQARFYVEPGDIFLLCSDGLTNDVTASEIQALIKAAALSELPENLLKLALSRTAKDNISILVAGNEK